MFTRAPSALGGNTGYLPRYNFSEDQNNLDFYRGPVLPPRADGVRRLLFNSYFKVNFILTIELSFVDIISQWTEQGTVAS